MGENKTSAENAMKELEKEKARQYYQRYYQKNKARIMDKNKKWREANKEKIAAYDAKRKKKWKAENKEECRAYMREYMRRYRKTGLASKRGICTDCIYLKDSWCAYKRLASPWEDKSCECEFWEK